MRPRFDLHAVALVAFLLVGFAIGQTVPYPQNYVLSFPRVSILSAPVSSQHDLGNAFTLETWIYRSEPAPLTGANMIIGKQSNTDKPYFLEYDGIGKIRFWVMNKVVTVPTPLVTRQWTHIAGTLSNGSIRLYVNGVLIGTTNNVPNPTNASTIPIQLGGAIMGTGWWCCQVEDTYLRQARIWKRALTQSEIQANMGLRMNGNEPDLAGQWMMDDGPGQVIRDSSVNHLDLQNGNTTGWDPYDARWVRTRVVDQLLYFQWETYSAVPNSGSIQGDLIDIDSDGDLDWFDFRSVWPATSDTAHVYRNNGAGVFTDVTSTVLPQEVRTYGVNREFKDFNGDGRTDIFFNDTGPDISPFPGGPVRILIQTPSGTFVDETASRLPSMTRLTMSTSSADIDGDGDIDILLTSRRSPGPELLINDGSGHFTINQSRLPAWVTTIQRPMMTGVFLNVNGDNFPDIYFGEQNDVTGRDAILINNGAGSFVDAPVTTLPPRVYGAPGYVLAARAADFNNDNRSDILISVSTVNAVQPNRLQIYLSNGDGTYRDGTGDLFQPNVGTNNEGIYYPYIADFNGDGKMDFITSAFAPYSYIYLNAGGGRFVDATDINPGSFNIPFPVPGDIDNDGDIDIVSAMNGQFAVLRNQHPLLVGTSPFDFDGDGKTDISIFRPNGATGSEWWYLKSSNGGNYATQFGTPTDKLVAADYTGDGKADIAFWRPSTGQWFVLRSEDQTFYAFPFGASGDIPAPADYDGDGKTDAAVFRPSTTTWYINKSTGGTGITVFGAAGDKPVPEDYDGDGKADIAVFRPNGTGGAEWWIAQSSGGVFATQFGQPTDKAVPADYTGDGKVDIAFWTPSNGYWYVLRSDDLSYYAFPFGTNGDFPVPADYDGDARADPGVFRPSNSNWYVNRTTAGLLIQQFGAVGDVPVPSEFVR